VEQLNLEPLKASYCGRGSQPYNPEMLVALLFYSSSTVPQKNFTCFGAL